MEAGRAAGGSELVRLPDSVNDVKVSVVPILGNAAVEMMFPGRKLPGPTGSITLESGQTAATTTFAEILEIVAPGHSAAPAMDREILDSKSILT